MKLIWKVLLSLVGLVAVAVALVAALTPWMDRWGARDSEIKAAYPGDELVVNPASFVNRGITIQAAPERIYPWLVQLGAGKGGMYSYTWLESLLRCRLVNADRIHAEWQGLQVGDLVKMCPDEPAPPPYIVAQIVRDQALVMGHQENGAWVDLWQFILTPQPDGSTRLVLRTRTMAVGGFWTVIHPGIFIMERGMLMGIKERAEATRPEDLLPTTVPTADAVPTADVVPTTHAVPTTQPTAAQMSITPTLETAPRLDPSATPAVSRLPQNCQVTDLNIYIDTSAAYCFAYPKRFTLGDEPPDHPPVLGPTLGGAAAPVQATLMVEVEPVDPHKTLEQQAEDFLKDFTPADLASFQRQPVKLGGEAGLVFENVPVQSSWRVVFARHGSSQYRLMFWPVDAAEARADVEELYQTTTSSFAFTD